jgi:YfiR/HmsC-like
MNQPNLNQPAARATHRLLKIAAIVILLGLLFAPCHSARSEGPALTEYQVKALFLLNFTKYVDWPANTFAQDNTPITIGVLGDDKFGDNVKIAVAGKTVGGRGISVQTMGNEDDWSKCQVLFVSASEKKHLPEILDRVRNLPTLTVGETEQFTQQGGIVNFIKKDGKIRLEIDLAASRLAKLQISSQLLKVADVVRGKN